MHDATGRRALARALLCGVSLAAAIAASPAHAQASAAQQSAIRSNCRADYQANCASVPPGGQASLACLQQNMAKLSPACQQAVGAVGGGGAAAATPAKAAPPKAAAAAASAPPAPAGPPAADTWPHTMSGPNGSATIYEPQVVSWPDHRTLNTRIALGITPTGAAKPLLGVIEVAFDTYVELAERTVFLSNPRLVSSKFPLADAAQSARIDERIKDALANLGVKRVPLATLTVSLARQAEKPADAPIDNRPPRIFVSARPASLVVFDGEPVTAPVDGTTLSVAVNTNWDVFRDASNNTWYLLNNGGWLAAPDAKGPWLPAGRLPSAFASLPNDRNFADVKKQMPGRTFGANDVPTVFVSTTPAAIIVTSGAPQFTAIPGTQLSYVSNTDAALFRMRNGPYFYLVSGRWFSAAALDGPWTFATPSLPPDFARIPADGPRGFVLVSVPGTPQAQEALLESQLPQQGTLDRATAKLDVVYAGAPQFAPIPATPLSYAVNTSFQVVQTGEGYFACYQGAWFGAPAPTGPWTLAPTVPAVIYTIPATSPLYPCTFVKVYATTPTTVTYGYTAGYTMSYVSAGVVVYGTGYYYPPYLYPAPIPIYYPYPYSYAGATYYNATTGAWAQGGAIYGPYGGAAKAGYAYNPNTGAYAQGGAIYGPNGGAGAFSAYNPSTGSYAHGSAAWGPDGAAGNASWYNANTGRSGSTQQNSNAYGRWGSSTISGPNQTVHTQSQSNQYGSAGSFSSSSGAKGAAVSGAGGNNAAAVKTSGGDVYAGADGNVYRKTDDGWQKYNDGSWNSVDKPTTQNASARNASSAQPTSTQTAQQRSTAEQRSTASGSGQYGEQRSAMQSRAGEGGAAPREGGGGFEGMGQLEQDRSARMQGGARQQQFEQMRGGGGFAGRGGGGFAGRGGGGGFRR